MNKNRKWFLLGASAGIAALLTWAFMEGREELARERERERPVSAASYASRTAQGETAVILDPEIQMRIGLNIEALTAVENQAPPPHTDLSPIQSALNVLDQEYERMRTLSPVQNPIMKLRPQDQGRSSESKVVVPSSAVVWHEGKPWVYVQMSPNTFVRRERGNARVGERVVVTGAEILLSEEIKSQIQVGEEGESE